MRSPDYFCVKLVMSRAVVCLQLLVVINEPLATRHTNGLLSFKPIGILVSRFARPDSFLPDCVCRFTNTVVFLSKSVQLLLDESAHNKGIQRVLLQVAKWEVFEEPATHIVYDVATVRVRAKEFEAQ